MEIEDKISLYLTRDNFLDILLDKSDRWSPDAVREILLAGNARDALFLGVTTYAEEEGCLDPLDIPNVSLTATGQMPLMIGKTFHLQLSKLMLEDIKTFAPLFAILLSIIHATYPNIDPAALSPLIPAIVSRVKILKKQLGEVCIVETIQENYSRNRRTGFTIKMIAHELGNESCRYPGKGCRFERNKMCKITKKNVEAIIHDFESKGIVERFTHEEPFEWRVCF